MPAHNPLEVFLGAAVLRSTPSEDRPALIESAIDLDLGPGNLLASHPLNASRRPLLNAPSAGRCRVHQARDLVLDPMVSSDTTLFEGPIAWASAFQVVKRSRSLTVASGRSDQANNYV